MKTLCSHARLHHDTWRIIAIVFGTVLGTEYITRPTQAQEPPAIVGQVKVVPEKIVLRVRRDPHSLLVLGQTAAGLSVDLTSQATFASSSDSVATVAADGWVQGVAAGTANITIVVAGQTLSVPVESQLPAADAPYSFRHEVMPVFSKGGCNQGSCHGYSLGKGGFKLSLRGGVEADDFSALTRDVFSRRVNPQDAPASLVLTKALGQVGHGGGVRFSQNSLSYEILKNWIAQGLPAEPAESPELLSVRIAPQQIVLAPGMSHRLQLVAQYADGSERDVTRLGIFTSNNAGIAEVSEAGTIKSNELGETAIVARYERKFAVANTIVLQPSETFQPAALPASPLAAAQLIDRPVIEKLNALRITPSPLVDDEIYLRRVYISLIGWPPKPEEILVFLADQDPHKRAKVVETLFAREEFVDQWSLKWADLLQNSRTTLSDSSVYALREWIRGAIAANMPLDEFARGVLTGRGGAQDGPTAAYYAISKDNNDTLERVTQVFCGVRMLCARCHSHPAENWTQADYYGVASFFTQVTTKRDPAEPNNGNAKILRIALEAGHALNPRSGQLQAPRYLGGAEPELASNVDRREAYAAWLTSAENPFFARGLVNRVWSYVFHRGIIEPVDDIRTTNPPINPALLDALTADFVAHKFDLRHLLRTIVTSETFQRSSQANDTNRHDEDNFSHFIPRRIPAEALLDSLVQATGVPENFGGAPGGFTAAKLPDANVNSDFLNLFGKPQRMEACECERDPGSNMLQSLHFINGKAILDRVQNPGSRVTQLLNQKLPPEKLVEEFYLWSLCRRPSEPELRVSLAFLAERPDAPAEAAQDLMWALLNSKDFMLLH